MVRTKKQMLLIIASFALVILLGTTTYAFFNYTRTGTANVIRTGRIAFSATQGDEVTLDNLFPITTSGEVTPETPGVGSVVIHVTGDTEYNRGIEYLVKAVNVTNTSGNSALPISISIDYEAATGNNKTIGDEDENYFSNRGGNTSLYKILSNNTIAEGKDLVVGYIAPGETGIDGNITIMAYLDASNIAITDTNPEMTYYERNASMVASELTACETLIATGYTGSETASAFCAGTGTRNGKTLQEHLDESLFTDGLIEDLLEANVINELYTDGTTDTWVRGRTVFTTEEWNALQANGVSFQIKVEANQGTWVSQPIDSCEGCKYYYSTQDIYPVWNNMSETPTVITTGLTDNYLKLMEDNNTSSFLGLKLNSSNQVTNAYVCSVRNNVPFCLEGSTDGSTYTANQTLLQGASLWNNNCTVTTSPNNTKCTDSTPYLEANLDNAGGVYIVGGSSMEGFFIDGSDGKIYKGALD